MTKDILERKKRLESRLVEHGITKDYITYLPYFEFDSTEFATPYETGCRMLIFYAIAYTASETDDREKIVNWLKRENLWSYISPKEKKFFDGEITDAKQMLEFSWQGECAYILAWALDLIKETPTPTCQVSDEQIQTFVDILPPLGEKTDSFLLNLNYRDTTEIYDENLFHELATTYFRDLLFSSNKDTTDIDRNVSFLRHQTLNWLRRFMDIKDWDETDTST